LTTFEIGSRGAKTRIDFAGKFHNPRLACATIVDPNPLTDLLRLNMVF
jgi:hypothetical protein